MARIVDVVPTMLNLLAQPYDEKQMDGRVLDVRETREHLDRDGVEKSYPEVP